MPVKEKDLETIVRLGINERDSTLVQISAFDGLGRATQLTRGWDDISKGDPTVSMATVIARLEKKVDAGEPLSGGDDFGELHLGQQGLGRYVANPYVGNAQFPGVWVGGPLQIGDVYDQRRGTRNRGLVQTLTLVHQVGHTFTVTNGNVVSDAQGTGAQASAALKKLRPVFRSGGRDPEAFADLFPPGDTVEIAWKYLTHESQGPLLSMSASEVKDAVNEFATGDRDWKPTEWDFAIDENTNAGVFTVRAVCKAVVDADSPEELAEAAHYIEPAKRDTIRNWGNGADGDGKGRGYFWTVAGRWKDIDPQNRVTLLENVDTDALGALVLGANPAWRTERKSVERQDDGLLVFEVVWTRPEHSNTDESVSVAHTDTDGWGNGTTVQYPTVPYDEAEDLLDGLDAPANSVVDSKSSRETEHGYNDVSMQTSQGWDYATPSLTPPNLPTYMGITAPSIEYRPDLCAGGGGYVATYRNVLPSAVNTVISRATTLVTPSGSGAILRGVSINQHQNGLCDVTATSVTKLYNKQFGSIVGSDYFTNVYRTEYDSLNIDGTGRVTDQHGAELSIKDVFGNVVPTVNVSGGTILFKRGVLISASYSRDAECKYHVTVTTEVAVARTWTYVYRTNRGGHPDTIVQTVYRNWDSPPPKPNSSHGVSGGYSFQLNRYGLYDGQVETRADIHEERSVRKSGDAHSYVETVGTRHSSSGPSRAAGLNGHTLVSTDDSTASDGLHDHTVSVETPKTSTHTERWTERRGGHSIYVEQQTFRNAGSAPSVSASGNQAADANVSVNKFDLVDAVVRRQTDVYVKTGGSHVEDAFAITDSDTVRVDPGTEPDVAFTPGRIVTTQNSNYTDNLTDREKRVVVAKADSWMYTYDHRWGRKNGDVATAYVYVWRNWSEGPTKTIGAVRVPSTSDSADYRYVKHVGRVNKNDFGLWDMEVSVVPTAKSASGRGRGGGPVQNYTEWNTVIQTNSDGGEKRYRVKTVCTEHEFFDTGYDAERFTHNLLHPRDGKTMFNCGVSPINASNHSYHAVRSYVHSVGAWQTGDVGTEGL